MKKPRRLQRMEEEASQCHCRPAASKTIHLGPAAASSRLKDEGARSLSMDMEGKHYVRLLADGGSEPPGRLRRRTGRAPIRDTFHGAGVGGRCGSPEASGGTSRPDVRREAETDAVSERARALPGGLHSAGRAAAAARYSRETAA